MPVENQITTLSVVKIAIKFSPCSYIHILRCLSPLIILCPVRTLEYAYVQAHAYMH